jgi:hypothetical protein
MLNDIYHNGLQQATDIQVTLSRIQWDEGAKRMSFVGEQQKGTPRELQGHLEKIVPRLQAEWGLPADVKLTIDVSKVAPAPAPRAPAPPGPQARDARSPVASLAQGRPGPAARAAIDVRERFESTWTQLSGTCCYALGIQSAADGGSRATDGKLAAR